MIPTLTTLALGAVGALIGTLIGLPMPLLTGPALATVAGGLSGLPTSPDKRLRETTFLVLGIGIGAGVTPDALHAAATWPLGFAALPVLLLAMMLGGRALLSWGFGFDRRSALLACTPGHLSFVFALSESLGLRADRIVLVQSIRLLMLSLLVPFAARAAGIDMAPDLTKSAPMPWISFAALLAASLAASPLLNLLAVPAPWMIAGLVISSLAQASGTVTGALHPMLATPALIITGALIGSRFSGVSWGALRDSALAGLASTALAAAITIALAVVIAQVISVPTIHLAAGYAPGGLQTMVIMGTALGANPAFIAGLHVARLMLLSALIPIMLGRTRD